MYVCTRYFFSNVLYFWTSSKYYTIVGRKIGKRFLFQEYLIHISSTIRLRFLLWKECIRYRGPLLNVHDRTRKIIMLCQIQKYKKIIVFIANFRFIREHLLTYIIIIFLANSLFCIATLKNNFLHCEDPDNQRPPVFYIILNALVGLCSCWKKI